MGENRWNECTAHIHRRRRNGQSVDIICDMPLHSDPADATAKHWDEELDIWWSYADGAPEYDTEFEG